MMKESNGMLQCNKCGHVFSDVKNERLILCPDCKNIRKPEDFISIGS